MKKGIRTGLAILSLLVPLCVSAGEIKGVVRDSGSKGPVAGATVMASSSVLPQGAIVVTDDNGVYVLPKLPAGEYTVSVVAATGATSEQKVTITEEQVMELAFAVDLGKSIAESYIIEVAEVGSRIKRDSFNGSAPIGIVTRGEATQSGLATTADLLQSNKVTGGSGQINDFFSGFVTEGGPGAETIGLRGLGPKRTLMLLNNRRLSPAGLRGAIGSFDIGALPSAIVDQVEILKDGASSVYGSDAIGGVVNIVTRKNINGFNLEGTFNVNASGGQEGRVSVVGGYTDNRAEISGSFEYFQRGELTLRDASWYGCPRALLVDKGRGQTLDFIDPRTGLPKCHTTDGFTINTIATNATNGVPAPGAVGTRFTRWRPNPQVTTGLVGFEGVGGGANPLEVRDLFDDQMLNQTLISPAKTFNGFLQGHYNLKILGDATPYFEFLWNRRESASTLSRQIALDYAVDSPLIPPELQGSRLSSGGSATSDGPIGVRAFIYGGNTRFEEVLNQYRATAGVQGKIGSSWNYDVVTNFSLASGTYLFPGWLTDRLKASLDVTQDPVEVNTVNPALVFDGRTCRSNINNPNANCIPAPALTNSVIFGNFFPEDGNTSGPAWVNYTYVPVVGTTTYSESSTVAAVDGTIFTIPWGGEVKTAVGLEFRTARIDDTPAVDSQNGNTYNLTTAAITRGTDSVIETFGELEVPLLKNLPAVHELTFNGSARYTNYKSYGSGFTFKAGGFYSPISWVVARANFGTSFRAPALFEQFQGATTGFISGGNDPCDGFQGLDPNTNQYKNCLADVGSIPQADNPNYPDFFATSGITVVNAGGAGANLAAETSKNLTAGIVLSPSLGILGNLAVAIDYYNIEINNSVAQVGAGTILAACYAQSPSDFAARNGLCRLITRTGTAGSLEVLDAFANVARDRVSGIDYTLRYTRDIGKGRFRVNGLLQQYFEQSNQRSELDRLIDFNGTLGVPKFTGTLDVSYTISGFKLFYGLRWTAAMSGFAGNTFDPPLVPANEPFNWDTPDFALHDASVSYAGSSWQVTMGLRNMFNTPPPSVSSGSTTRIGNAPLYSGYDFAGRALFINASAEF